MPEEIVLTAAPLFSMTAGKKLSACKAGEIVWFVGGYMVAGDHRSFGRRACVQSLDVKRGGVWLRADDEPKEPISVSALVTAGDVRETLARCSNETQRQAVLTRLQLQPADLQRFDAKLGAEADAVTEAAQSLALSRMTKSQLIELVRQLQGQLANAQSGKPRKTTPGG